MNSDIKQSEEDFVSRITKLTEQKKIVWCQTSWDVSYHYTAKILETKIVLSIGRQESCGDIYFSVSNEIMQNFICIPSGGAQVDYIHKLYFAVQSQFGNSLERIDSINKVLDSLQ